MKAEYKPYVEELIELAIKEDIGDGDHTSLCCIPAEERGRMRLLCKQEGIIAGIEVAKMVTERLDSEVKFEQILNDGDRVKVGDVAFYVEVLPFTSPMMLITSITFALGRRLSIIAIGTPNFSATFLALFTEPRSGATTTSILPCFAK